MGHMLGCLAMSMGQIEGEVEQLFTKSLSGGGGLVEVYSV